MRRLILLLLVFNTAYATEIKPSGYAIATAHPLATQAGQEVLQAGGNAFDAAVAISAALAVVEPYGSGLGGGGFWLLHEAKNNTDIVIDGREVAPLAVTPTMYLDKNGNLTRKSIDGPLAAGIPGVVAALEFITTHYGNLSLQENLQAAIRFAEEGFAAGNLYVKLAGLRKQALQASPAASKVFLLNDEVPPVGHIIRQTDLGKTLTSIAQQGASVFYTGELAQRMVQEVEKAGGIWQLEDLRQYQVIERQPIRATYKEMEIILPPPPTSGGVVISQILAMLEKVNLQALNEVQKIHIVVEAMRRAYQDRALYLGDPAFTDIPLQQLLNKQYARKKFADFDAKQASKSKQLPIIDHHKGEDTTHFSVLDAQGNYAAATLSINYPFGSGFVIPGMGILLNDEMDDFSMGEGVANAYGLIGSDANAIAPKKRMLSSMTPLFAYDKQRTLIVGTPGGSRIISMLALALLTFEQGGNSSEIVNKRRYHHQYIPDEIQFEMESLNKHEQQALAGMGHKLNELSRKYGNMHAIIWDKRTNEVDVASDARGEGKAILMK